MEIGMRLPSGEALSYNLTLEIGYFPRDNRPFLFYFDLTCAKKKTLYWQIRVQR